MKIDGKEIRDIGSKNLDEIINHLLMIKYHREIMVQSQILEDKVRIRILKGEDLLTTVRWLWEIDKDLGLKHWKLFYDTVREKMEIEEKREEK